MQSHTPTIEWNDGEFKVSLPFQGGTLDVKCRPVVTNVIRISEAGSDTRSPGFETPLNNFSFVGLAPDTENEIKITHENTTGEVTSKAYKMQDEIQWRCWEYHSISKKIDVGDAFERLTISSLIYTCPWVVLPM